MSPVVVPNALPTETCDFLTNFALENTNAFVNEHVQVIPQFLNKTLGYKQLHRSMPSPFIEVERTLNYARHMGQKFIFDQFGEIAFADNTELTFWNPGDSMSLHADNCWAENVPDHIKDTPHPTGFRDYSAIFYLNDDYEGGEINFPNFDLTIKPEKGSAVFFPSGLEHSHSVSEVKGKKRITIAVWYSLDVLYAE